MATSIHGPLVPEYPINKWRKNLIFGAERNNIKILDTFNVNLTEQNAWGQSLVPIQKSSFIAVGCGSRTKNFYILEHLSQNKLDAPDDYEPQEGLKLVSSFNFPCPTYHITTLGNKLITAGPDGSAQLYRIDLQEMKTGKGLEHVHEIVFSDEILSNKLISSPGTLIQSVRVNHVALEPCGNGDGDSARRVSGIIQNKLYIYDLPTQKVLSVDSFGKDRLTWADYSSHDPSGSLLAICGIDSKVSILDTRQMGKLAWSVEKAHESSVTNVAFNPFIPYWLASSGLDGVVKIWDLRFMSGDVARINGHYDGVQSIAWSNTHAEIISTASFDRYWRAWSLDPDITTTRKLGRDFIVGIYGSEFDDMNYSDKYACVGASIIGSYSQYDSPLISVQASPTHADTFFTLDAIGKVSSHCIRHEVFQETVRHEYEDITAQQVETALFCRQINTAYDTMVKLDRTTRPPSKYTAPHQKELIEACTIIEPIKSDWIISGMVADTKKMQLLFNEELRSFMKGLPPGYGGFNQWISSIHSWNELQYRLVVLRFKIVTRLQEGDWQFVVDCEKAILQGLDVDPEYMDTDTLSLIIETLLLKSYLKALVIGLKAGTVLSDVQRFDFSGLSPILGLLVFPTVFDKSEWLPQRESIRMSQTDRQLMIEKFKSQNETESPTVEVKATQRGRSNSDHRARSNTETRARSNTRRRAALQTGAERPTMEGGRKKSISQYVNDSKQILPMISLELKLMKQIENHSADSDQDVVKIMQSVLIDSMSGKRTGGPTVAPFEHTISAWANILYLDSLLNLKQYEEFIGVGCNLVQKFPGEDFTQLVCNIMGNHGITLIKEFLDGMLNSASQFINSNVSNQQQNIQAILKIKTSLVMLIKVTAYLIDGQETTKDKNATECYSKILTLLTQHMLQHSAMLIKLLDKLGKGTIPRETVQAVHDAIRDAARTLPLSANRDRKVQLQDKVSSGYAIHEETFSLLDRLYKGYIKVQE